MGLLSLLGSLIKKKKNNENKQTSAPVANKNKNNKTIAPINNAANNTAKKILGVSAANANRTIAPIGTPFSNKLSLFQENQQNKYQTISQPVKTQSEEQKKKTNSEPLVEKKRNKEYKMKDANKKWTQQVFRKGALKDGFNAKNFAKSVLATGTDITQDVAQGILQVPESIGDITLNAVATASDMAVKNWSEIFGSNDTALLGGTIAVNKDTGKKLRDFANVNLAENISTGVQNPFSMAYNVVNGTPENIVNPMNIKWDKNKSVIDNYGNNLKKTLTEGSSDKNLSYEKDSLMGYYADEAVKLIGYTAGIAGGTQMLGKSGDIPVKLGKHTLKMPTLALTGGMSSGLQEANSKENVSESERWGKAVSSGLIEAFTEGMFGMFGVGGSDLDDALVKAASSKFKSSVGKTLASLGIKSFGESTEELLSYALNFFVDNNIIDKLGNSDFSQEWDWKEVGEQMALAFASTVLSQGGSEVITTNNAIKYAEKEAGRKLTNKEKALVTQAAIDRTMRSNIENKETKINQDNSVSLSEQLEKQGTRIMEDSLSETEAMIDNFKTYLEENNIKNPTQKDIDDSIVDMVGYDNELDDIETANKEQKYNQVIQEYLKEQNNNTNKTESNNDSFNLKQKQLDIIKENNPMQDDYHTGIRELNDIKTLEETLQDSDYEGYDEFNPDLTRQDIQKAIDTGKITVYSSYPIEQGVFVSPSQMEAQSYSRDGKVYSKEVNINDVAWIDPTQGQYAEVENNINNDKYIDKDIKIRYNSIEEAIKDDPRKEPYAKYNNSIEFFNLDYSRMKKAIAIGSKASLEAQNLGFDSYSFNDDKYIYDFDILNKENNAFGITNVEEIKSISEEVYDERSSSENSGLLEAEYRLQEERNNNDNQSIRNRRASKSTSELDEKTKTNELVSNEKTSIKDSKELDNSSFSNETNQQEKAVKKVIAPLHEEIKALRKEISDIKAPIKEIEHQEKLYEDIENDDVIQARLIDDNVSKKSSKSNRQKTKPSKEVIAPLSKESSNNTTNENTTKETAKKLTRKEVRQQLLKEMGIDESAISSGKDISSMNYQLTDPIRVNEKVFGRELGKKINEVTVEQTKHNTAEKIRWLNQERTEIKELGIKPRSKESAAVQKYGEKQYVNKQGEVVPYGDKELMSEFPNVKTQEKIKKASEILRNKYDQYIDQINGTLEALGYDPIPKRKDYMRHFSELGDVFSQTGVPFNLNDMKAEDLPTDINGLTEFNKPGKNWFASSQKRYGVKTNYDAITGIDGYLEGASNLIFHTEDIQRYRALSTLIRETYGQTKGFEKLDGLTNEQIQQRIKDIQSNKLSKYVAWLDEQANNLAGKKGALDRGVERAIGRRAYTVLNTIKKQTGSNMTGFNVRSAMTNFISSTIASAKTNKIAMVKGTAATIRNMFHNDGFINKSDFLTSRFGSDMISSKMWQKASNAGQIFMTGSDYLTSNIITRSKYYEGLHKGMTETQAIKYADDFAARVMGDRSQGATAEAFNSKTLGVLTQFQLEVNNQWQYMIHDSKMDYQSIKANTNGINAGATIVFQMGQLAAFSYFFNELFEKLTGSRAAFDPIEIIKELFGIDDDDDKTLEQRTQSAISTLLEAVPFASLFTSGGRLPISEMLEPFSTTLKAVSGGTDKYGNRLGIKDIPKSVTETAGYYLLPTGYSQLKKTTQGLSMFSKDKEIKGSYTDSGKLRFPIKDTTSNRIKSGLFGQWSSNEAKEYINSGMAPLNEAQTLAYKKLSKYDVSINDYRNYKKEISKIAKENDDYTESKKKIINTIKNMDIPDEAKYILYNTSYNKNNTFNIAEKIGIGADEFLDYASQTFKADKDKNGNSISGSKKTKVINYINSMDIDDEQKLILYKLEYNSDNEHNNEIIDYLNNSSVTYEEEKYILEKLGFKVKKDGTITWE